jgi:hypothetical protein
MYYNCGGVEKKNKYLNNFVFLCAYLLKKCLHNFHVFCIRTVAHFPFNSNNFIKNPLLEKKII